MIIRNGFCSRKNLRCGFLAGSTYRSWVVILHLPILYIWVLRMDDRDELRRLIDVIEKASASVQLDQAIEDIKTFANTTSFLVNKLDTRLKGGDIKAKKQPKSRIGKAIAAPPAPKPNVPKPQQATPDSAGGGMPSAASTATSQADYDRLKPQGTQSPISSN